MTGRNRVSQCWRFLKIIVRPAVAPAISLLAFLVAIISIPGIVLGFLGFEPPRDPQRTRYQAARIRIEILTEAVGRFKADCGSYPSGEQGLNALLTSPGTECWAGPYVSTSLHDPWGRPYIYRLLPDSGEPEILSYGADGLPGGDYFDADLSTRRPVGIIPEAPSEKRRKRSFAMFKYGSWGLWIGSVLLHWTAARLKRRNKAATAS